MKKKATRGGARKGAGRPKTGKETTVMTFRVPAEKAAAMRERFKKLLQK